MRELIVMLSVGAVALCACVGVIGDSDSRKAPELDARAPLVWLPARVRRLSNRELDNSVKDLLGTTTVVSTLLGRDSRQSGFTLNAEQRVDATYGGQLQSAANALAEEAVTQRLGTLA